MGTAKMVSINCGDVVELEVRSELGKNWVSGMVMELGQVEGDSFAHVRACTALSDTSYWLPVGKLTRVNPNLEAKVMRTDKYYAARRAFEAVLLSEKNDYEDVTMELLWDWMQTHKEIVLSALRHMEDCPYDGTVIIQ